MKIRSWQLCSAMAIAGCSRTVAWTPMAPVSSKQCFTTATTSASALSMSAIAPPEETLATSDKTTTAASPFAHQIPGKTVAEGNIVSFFNGGFAAVRLKDDEPLGSDEATPIPNQQQPQQQSSSSSSSSNLGDDLIGRLARLPNGSMGVVLALRPPVAFVYSDCSEWDDESSENVEIFETMATISVPEHVLNGGIVNCFGQGEESSPSSSSSSLLNRAMLAPIPQVKDIALINSPMLTGSTMVDALAPIGKGQNMLLVGSDLNEMRGLACDFLSTQLRNPQSVCVYAATQDREAALSKLQRAGIADDVIVVGARNQKPGVAKAAEAASVAATACAIGESFALQQGKDAIVVVDTIDAHKELWDATTRVLVDVYGTEAVVKADREGAASSEMRAYYSSLIQRSAQFNARNGGGSLTLALLTTIPGMDGDDGSSEEVEFSASDFEGCGDKIKARIDMLVDKKIPLTVATLRKIQIPIPSASEGRRRLALQHIDDLISMSDGQIWLDDDLQRQGQRPPMDPQRSITRIGIGADTQSRADAPAIRRVVEGVRLDLAQAANMEGAEATTASMKQIRKRNAWLLAMHQEEGDGGRTLAESCVVLLAAANGLLDDTIDAGALAGTEEGHAVVSQLLDHVKSRAPGAMEAINESLDIGPEARSEIEEAMDSFIP